MLAKKTRVPDGRKSPRKHGARQRKQPGQERSRETVNVILEAAARVLETRGLEGYNTNAVAERAGVSIGSIYQYFPNKDAILIALIVLFEEELLTAVRTAMTQPAGRSLKRALKDVVDAFYDAHHRRTALHRLLELEEGRLEKNIPERLETLDLLVKRFLQPYRAEIRIPIAVAAEDAITISRGMIDTALQSGTLAAAAKRRTLRALCAYLLYEERN